MYAPIKGGAFREVQGLKCWMPPQPSKSDIQNHHLPKKQQVWKRTELPTFSQKQIDIWSGEVFPADERLDWETARREETIKQTGYDPWDLNQKGEPRRVQGIEVDPNYVSPALESFRTQELDRFFNGHWIYINGEAVYLTGVYYFYLNYWKLNTGFAEFRQTDLNLFYYWQYCKEDPVCYGLIEITKRGQGKSYRAGCVAYYETITNINAHVGIQSKTDEDASDFFKGKIVEPMKDLPDFLVPLNNHGTDPQKRLSFFAPAVKGKNARFSRKNKLQELRSYLTYRNANNLAYDGTTLKFLIQDEIGKLEKKVGDAKERLGVNRECVFRDGKMVGKIWATTTVEKMENGGQQCKEIWYESLRTKLTDLGMTTSGLYPFFTSASECTFFDQFGESVPDQPQPYQTKYLLDTYGDIAINGARSYHLSQRKKFEDDPYELTSYIQKNPETIEEAFRTTGKGCIYHAGILTAVRDRLTLPGGKKSTLGDFVWKDGIVDGKVVFVPNPINGKWEVSWLYDVETESNQRGHRTDILGKKQFYPIKTGQYGIAFDPFSHMKTVSSKGSNAAAAVLKKFNFHQPEFENTFVADYLARPLDPEEAFEDVLMAAIYYGDQVLIENNKNAAIQYFKKRGYYEYVMLRPKSSFTSGARGNQGTDGIPSNTPVIEYYINLMKSHVIAHGHKLKHLRIVEQLLEFDPDNRTKYDLGVASQLALIAAEKKPTEDDFSYDLSEMFNNIM